MRTVPGVLLGLALGVVGASAQEQYPSRTVRIIVPSTPGGVTDILARVIAQALSQSWGQPVIVDNRPGADEMIGTDAVAKSPADGYTLLVTSNAALTSVPHLHSQMRYDALKDFTLILALGQVTPVMNVPASSPVHSVQELIALAKAKPGELNYGSFGNGSYVHIAMEDFKLRTGTQLTHIPYKGSSPAIIAMLRGEIAVLIVNMSNVAEHVKAGTIRIIAAAGAQRPAIRPDLPTVAEAGIPGFSTGSWWGLLGPADLPRAVVDKIRAEVTRALAAPEARKVLATNTFEPVDTAPDQLAQFMRDDFDRWGRMIKAAGIKLD
jgi:tripartite-type tricarboxylate transporter receptor subunit TctC